MSNAFRGNILFAAFLSAYALLGIEAFRFGLHLELFDKLWVSTLLLALPLLIGITFRRGPPAVLFLPVAFGAFVSFSVFPLDYSIAALGSLLLMSAFDAPRRQSVRSLRDLERGAAKQQKIHIEEWQKFLKTKKNANPEDLDFPRRAAE